MRFFSAIFIVAVLAGGPANAFQECHGSPAVRVFWEKSILQVGNSFYQMRKEKLGKKSTRLTGHEMIFVRSKGSSNLLIRSGSTTHYECEKIDDENGGLTKAQVIPYVANRLVLGNGETGLDPDKAGGNDKATSNGSKSGSHHGKKG